MRTLRNTARPVFAVKPGPSGHFCAHVNNFLT
jgi:hypothetical protein